MVTLSTGDLSDYLKVSFVAPTFFNFVRFIEMHQATFEILWLRIFDHLRNYSTSGETKLFTEKAYTYLCTFALRINVCVCVYDVVEKQ